MRYSKVITGVFVSRPNRFIALVDAEGERHTVHVKNTGRCRELLVPGATVYLAEASNPARRTRYDLIAVEKGRLLINMDSQVPPSVAEEWLRRGTLFSADAVIRREVVHGDSRFDLYAEDGDRRAFIEVKGVTLEKDGVASFPDAPTARGVKHLRGLARAVEEGYEAYVIFVIQMKGPLYMTANDATDPTFGEALRQAAASGVGVLAVDSLVTACSITAGDELEVRL